MNHLRLRQSGEDSGRAPPPWEAVYLVGHHLDAKTLATASCASKSWLNCLSSDHLWRPLFSAAFPYGEIIGVPYRRLYAAFHAARNRRHREPPKPTLALRALLFMVSVNTPAGPAKTVTAPCMSLAADPAGLFRFDIGLDDVAVVGALDGVRVTWHVAVEGWARVFRVMECGHGRKQLRSGGGEYGWFSEDLPAPGCCSGSGASGLVGELMLGVRYLDGGEKVVVEKVRVGVLSVYSWRYVKLDDALRYLQHFLS